MTQFARPAIPALSMMPDLEQVREQARQQRAQLMDRLIGQHRLTVPPGLVEKRKRQRLTTPLIRFLDLIDLPRNSVANMIFGDASIGQKAGGIGFTAAAGAAFGAFGGPVGALIGAGVGAGIGLLGIGAGEAFVGDELQRQITLSSERRGMFAAPVIFGSDILKAMGVENRVVRAVLGFAGDLVMDPLMYVSGGGNVVKWTAQNGTRLMVAKPAKFLLDDIGEHVARTGSYEGLSKAHQAIIPLFEDTVEITGAMRAMAPKVARKRIGAILRGEVTEALFREGRQGELAQEFFRRYAASSARQFTIPFAGFLAEDSAGHPDRAAGQTGRVQEGPHGVARRVRREPDAPTRQPRV
jgi:hypothetical protein